MPYFPEKRSGKSSVSTLFSYGRTPRLSLSELAKSPTELVPWAFTPVFSETSSNRTEVSTYAITRGLVMVLDVIAMWRIGTASVTAAAIYRVGFPFRYKQIQELTNKEGNRRWAGCRCSILTTSCSSKVCPCFIAGRECDPELCRGCHAKWGYKSNSKLITYQRSAGVSPLSFSRLEIPNRRKIMTDCVPIVIYNVENIK